MWVLGKREGLYFQEEEKGEVRSKVGERKVEVRA
jgi:hypothetical protein